MSVSMSGLEVSRGSRAWRDAVELLSSMRFAIALFTILCIASVIGTVVKQNEPFNNYVNQFGPFWAEVFGQVQLFTVYSAPWFLAIVAVLVVSTSLCIARNLPKILQDLRTHKEGMRETALQAFHHRGDATSPESREAAVARVAATLAKAGWSGKQQQRENGTMFAVRKGKPNKIGYLAAHSAIVLICLGGLLDGNMVVRAQMALFDKAIYTGGGLIPDVPERYRLGPNNPTFRGNLLVPEGAQAGVAILSMPSGVVLQDLPFDVELKRFIVEYHATGMPKLFASEIVIHDHATKQKTEHRVEVNKPVFHRGVAIYQSSFDDGGSRVTLRGWPLGARGQPFDVNGVIGGSTPLVGSTAAGESKVTLEYAALRVINVENLGAGLDGLGGSATDVRAVDLVSSVQERLGTGTRVVHKKELRNIGPSVTYRLRDAAGQAREYHNYMVPIELEGQNVFLLGMRETPQESFRYLRAPADEQGRLATWLRMRQALEDPAMRAEAARRYVAIAAPADRPEVAAQLLLTTQRALNLFAGAESAKPPQAAGAASAPSNGDGEYPGGLQALSDFMEHSVPEGERQRIAEVLLRIVNGALYELVNVAREAAGEARLPPDDKTQRFMTAAVTSLSDSFFYPAPVVFELANFTQVQASVFQVARAPGKTLVYLGSVALILGVFVMLYVRDRRLWVWVASDPANPEHCRIATAMSTTRRTLETDTEFEHLKAELLPSPRP
jgi:cytochrome c biogenesis protein